MEKRERGKGESRENMIIKASKVAVQVLEKEEAGE